MNTRPAEQVADAILHEGYVLYPYRASAAKNRFRWQVGLLTPRPYAEATGSDPWHMQTECLADAGPDAMLTVRVRCLHVQERAVEEPVETGGPHWRRVQSTRVGKRQLITWDEAVVCEFVREGLPLSRAPRELSWPWVLGGSCTTELVYDHDGRLAARLVRRREGITAVIRIAMERSGGFCKLRVRIENLTRSPATTLAARGAAVRQSLAATHTILGIEAGGFVSLLEPPPDASALAAGCRNVHTFPVLVGASGSRELMLSSPIILYDYPAVAPESPGDLCDATEIDEMLVLRVRTLTEAEKQEARATDGRAARIVDRCDALSAGTLQHLHGAVRQSADAAPLPAAELAVEHAMRNEQAPAWESFLNPPGEPPPEVGTFELNGTTITRGSRVRLEPTRRSDSLDLCLRGRSARVSAVYHTLEGAPYIAVTLDDDPFGEAGTRYRRALFFHPEELVPADGGEP